MRLFTIDIHQNNHFGSHGLAVLYEKPHYSEARYNEVELNKKYLCDTTILCRDAINPAV